MSDDHMISWAHARAHPGWLIPLVCTSVGLLVVACVMIFLRVETFTVRVIPDTGKIDLSKQDLPSDQRMLDASWQICHYIDVWRSKDIANRFAQASAFLSPKIRGEIKDYFSTLRPKSNGLTDVSVARTILPIAGRVLEKNATEARIGLVYHSIDMVEEVKTVSFSRDDIQVLYIVLTSDVITDENPYGVLAESVDRKRADDHAEAEKFWKKP